MTIRICPSIIDHSRPLSAGQNTCRLPWYWFLLALLASLPFNRPVQANSDPMVFDDTPLTEPLSLPAWFKLSFLDLQEDLTDAIQGKRGLIVYFGRNDCPYCKALLETNWGRPDIIAYTRQHFDVIAMDVLGNRQVTDIQGKELSEKDYAAQQQANFTPTLHFYDKQGKLAYKLTGYRPPYQFKAVLEYVADDHHRQESFAEYYARAESAYSYGHAELNRHPDIRYSDKKLDLRPAGKPILVLFERPRCHACDVLHAGPLLNELIVQRLQKFDAVQLDISDQQPVITPAGRTTTSQAWARQLKLDYTPTLIFFDEQGKETIRIDSVVWFYRLSNILDYVLTKGYRRYPSFQQWRGQKK